LNLHKRAGANKILFGSDGPWMHPGLELGKIFALHPDESSLNKMLSRNFLKLIRNVQQKKLSYA